MRKIFGFICHPRILLIGLLEHIGKWIPDKPYLKIQYYLHTGCRLHLDNPVTFNEKIQWLKLNDRNVIYKLLVDKYEVKEYVAKTIGKDYIIPTLGVWNSFDEINFDILPQKFVLKTTHDGGGGGVIICDKSNLNADNIKKKIKKSLKHNIYYTHREWPYKDLKPRIMAEVYIQQESDSLIGLDDYKFFCFNGNPKFCQVKTHDVVKDCIDLFDMQWNLLPFTCLNPAQKNAEHTPEKPVNFDKMIGLTKKLCGVATFARVDFYNVNGVIYFGEITFYPSSGMGQFTPKEYDVIVGEWLKDVGLKNKKNE